MVPGGFDAGARFGAGPVNIPVSGFICLKLTHPAYIGNVNVYNRVLTKVLKGLKLS